MQGYFLDYKANTVICREGDPSNDLFFLKKGKILICTINGTEVKAIARIGAGEFIGELSFFDGRPRSSYIVALEDCRLIQIPKSEVSPHLPFWYIQAGMNLTKKIRLLDTIIHDSHIRKSAHAENRPLSIEEQRDLFEILTN